MSTNYWEKDDFEHFLRFLADDEGYTANAIINVVAEPYKWEKDYQEWIIKEAQEPN